MNSNNYNCLIKLASAPLLTKLAMPFVPGVTSTAMGHTPPPALSTPARERRDIDTTPSMPRLDNTALLSDVLEQFYRPEMTVQSAPQPNRSWLNDRIDRIRDAANDLYKVPSDILRRTNRSLSGRDKLIGAAAGGIGASIPPFEMPQSRPTTPVLSDWYPEELEEGLVRKGFDVSPPALQSDRPALRSEMLRGISTGGIRPVTGELIHEPKSDPTVNPAGRPWVNLPLLPRRTRRVMPLNQRSADGSLKYLPASVSAGASTGALLRR